VVVEVVDVEVVEVVDVDVVVVVVVVSGGAAGTKDVRRAKPIGLDSPELDPLILPVGATLPLAVVANLSSE